MEIRIGIPPIGKRNQSDDTLTGFENSNEIQKLQMSTLGLRIKKMNIILNNIRWQY